jgi:hypothetical protein
MHFCHSTWSIITFLVVVFVAAVHFTVILAPELPKFYLCGHACATSKYGCFMAVLVLVVKAFLNGN